MDILPAVDRDVMGESMKKFLTKYYLAGMGTFPARKFGYGFIIVYFFWDFSI